MAVLDSHSRILVINSGSSSVKCNLFAWKESAKGKSTELLCTGRISWTGTDSAEQTVTRSGAAHETQKLTGVTFNSAVEGLLKAVAQSNGDGSENKIVAVGHRVVHGGDKYSSSVLINSRVVDDLRALIELAPTHEKANVDCIEIATEMFKDIPQVAVFDTAFHQTMPEVARVYAGPYEWYQKLGIRRYGFHGINHSYCAERAAELLSKPLSSLRTITCHLGGGASLAAIDGGKSIMTTMGYTPLEGLMMTTRSGSIDPGILLHLLATKQYSVEQLQEELNRNSGLKGISGSCDNMKDVAHQSSNGDKRAKLAFDMYIHSLQMYIGSMIGVLGGLDAIVFSGGIGENSAQVRAGACENLVLSASQLINRRMKVAGPIKIFPLKHQPSPLLSYTHKKKQP